MLALVTGASRGVGAAIAGALADTHEVLLGGRDEAALRTRAAGLRAARPFVADLTDHTATAAAVSGIDRLDVLVHSAGVATLGAVADTSAEVWRTTMETNVIAVAELTRRLLPALRAARGHVVLVNSTAGLDAHPRCGAYAASKFALRAFADALRGEEPTLRVTSVYPGRVDTDMQRSIRAQEGLDYEPENYLRPESVAAAVVSVVTATPDAHVQDVVVRAVPQRVRGTAPVRVVRHGDARG
ncbi:SDR family oxidoreductase [Saccharothrix xinjiangensis]|uniref:SDR family oxidoreductase n=1 Tax=Saccharothrix xinjiangensis TaxID=204798 RepID=A0ABV9YDK3_9PSEU